MDDCGISAQHTYRIGRSWTMYPLLRIRRLGGSSPSERAQVTGPGADQPPLPSRSKALVKEVRMSPA